MNTHRPKVFVVCDGCGQTVPPEHWRRRIERLQWASRFRPVHIRQLVICEAPPENPADELYLPATGADAPGPTHWLVEAFLEAYGLPPAVSREVLLKTLQHHGIFVAEAVECPVEPSVRDRLLVERERILYERIRFSYRPRHLLLLTERLRALPEWLRESAIPYEQLPATAGPRVIAAALK